LPFFPKANLTHLQATAISIWAVTAREGSSRLGVFIGFTSLSSLVDMLLVTGEGFGS